MKFHSHAGMGRKVQPDNEGAGYGEEEIGNTGGLIRAVIVNDSPNLLKTLSAFLEKQRSIQLIGAVTDGCRAVRRVLELEPDLVLMALRLPGMNGLEVARQIKAHAHAPAIIIVAADDTPECRAAADTVGTDGFVGKRKMFNRLHAAITRLFPGTRV